MMSGRLSVDGIDVYSRYGVYVPDGGWLSLIAFPPLKEPEQNDWHEEDGVELDLSAPVLNTREISLSFVISGDFTRYIDFTQLLSDGSYHSFYCAAIGRTYTLRLVSQSNREYAANFGRETLKFADDFPLAGYTYKVPSSNMTPNYDYRIDGFPTTKYGLRVLQGTLAEVIKTASVKQNLLRNIKSQNGAIYDDEIVTYKAKDVKLNCLMRADNLTQLWRNYDALLYDLIQPKERTLRFKEIDKYFPFCYKSCTVTEFFSEDKIWLKFQLTLTFTRNFRIFSNALDGVRIVNNELTLRLTSNGNFRFNN